MRYLQIAITCILNKFMQTVLITGGTGMVGKAIATLLLDKGYHVIVLTRKAPVENPRKPGIEYALWNIKAQTIDINALQKADHIIHLAGAGVVDKKWTAAYKQEIQESRTESSKLIIDALKNNPNKVKTVVSASAIGWYEKMLYGGQRHLWKQMRLQKDF
jgi:NAD dependent epimerase/dehydratase family enzyme